MLWRVACAYVSIRAICRARRSLMRAEIISFFHLALAFAARSRSKLKDNLIAWVVIFVGARERWIYEISRLCAKSLPRGHSQPSNMCTCVCGSVRSVCGSSLTAAERPADRPPLWRTSSLARSRCVIKSGSAQLFCGDFSQSGSLSFATAPVRRSARKSSQIYVRLFVLGFRPVQRVKLFARFGNQMRSGSN
jgi:hypothetical protein